ncbi:MAG: endonuclease/exonuclease/phosphatase family protein [Planctomycetes bacterium]|nr:endonuclease/exonuclease/phosphatase family protein [Planctomycetota bacterium]
MPVDESPRTLSTSPRLSVWSLPWLGLIAAASSMLAACGARWWWFLELFCHFHVQYLALSLAMAVPFVLARRWKGAAAAAVLIIINLACIVPLYVAAPAGAVGPHRARILFLNVEQTNHAYAEVLKLVAELDPDVVALVEVDHVWMRQLLPLLARYPDLCSHPRHDAFGIAVFSRLPGASEIVLAGGELPSAVLRLDGLTVVATHPVPPLGQERARWRDRQLHELAVLAAAETAPTILGGDFNCTPWSPVFHDLLRDGRLRDSHRGFGVQASWPSFAPPLWIPIDHCVVSSGVTVLSRTVGRRVGSDHYPLIVDLAY